MVENPEANRRAWQPLTFGGVAAFAEATWKRLWLVQFIFAMLVAALGVWFFDTAWFPTLREAIRELPAAGRIQAGRLNWPEEPPRLLADGRFLALAVDLNHTGAIRSVAHLQVEIGRSNLRCLSLFGYADWAYPAGGRTIAVNRSELEPWWGAWAPPILWLAFGALIVGMMVLWALWATVSFLPVWLAGYFANRQLSLSGSWKLAGAALMPGTLLLAAAILFYGVGVLDLVQLLAAGIAHLALGLVFSVASPFLAPRLSASAVARGNPFVAPANREAGKEGETPPPKP